MRYTPSPRPALSPRLLTSSGALIALLAALAGCPDSPHLYPPDASAGAADAGANACISNAECAYPAAVCDTARSACVECLTFDDCASRPGTVCSAGKCACLDEVQVFCPAVKGQKERCVDLQITSADCGICGHACLGVCVSGACADGWEAITSFGAPEPRARHAAVWDEADKVMVVWGGINKSGKVFGNGGLYNVAENRWAPVSSLKAPTPRHGATAVWDDAHKAMIVWGGLSNPNDGWLNTGALFYPATNTWEPMPTNGAPSPRAEHAAVWTGDRLIVWGGANGNGRLDDGGIFDPEKKQWTAVAAGGPLGRRAQAEAVWDGKAMLAWGGIGTDDMGADVLFGNGAAFDGASNWSELNGGNQPSPRRGHTAVWTGTSMLIWGGVDPAGARPEDGGAYKGGAWSPFNGGGVIEGRIGHTAVWVQATGEMIVWGGDANNGLLNTGARLKEEGLTWAPMAPALSPRRGHSAVVAGTKMLVWGGDTGGNSLNDGGIFDATVAR